MKLIFATWLFDASLGKALTKKKAKNRLLSFHFLREQKIKPEDLQLYCETGRYRTKKK